MHQEKTINALISLFSGRRHGIPEILALLLIPALRPFLTIGAIRVQPLWEHGGFGGFTEAEQALDRVPQAG